MTVVSIRTLSHNLARYLKQVKRGSTILITERNIPIAELVPHAKNNEKPGWKRTVKIVAVKGISERYVEMMRQEESR